MLKDSLQRIESASSFLSAVVSRCYLHENGLSDNAKRDLEEAAIALTMLHGDVAYCLYAIAEYEAEKATRQSE